MSGSGTTVPHLNNLPQWSRINTLDKARYPRTFVKDQKVLEPIQIGKALENNDSDSSEFDLKRNELSNSEQRIQHLERSIKFLQEQHHNVLSNLHSEVDELKKLNQTLQFRIIAAQKEKKTDEVKNNDKTPVMSAKSRQYRAANINEELFKMKPKPPPNPLTEAKLDNLTVTLLEQEIKETKKILKEEKEKYDQLVYKFEEVCKENAEIKYKFSELENKQKQVSTLSINPNLEITDNLIGADQFSSIAEYEIIIKNLKATNEQQANELSRLKTDLKDVLYSHKWTPDAFLSAKAYVLEDEYKDIQSLPKLHSRKIPELSHIQQKDSTVCLPALKQTMGNKAIERRKRTQVLQKARLRKEMVPINVQTTESGTVDL